MTMFETKEAAAAPDAIAPDGSEVRLLCSLGAGGMAEFRLPAGKVSKAVSHRTVEEIWYFTAGIGHLWRALDGREEVTPVRPGVSLTIPLGTAFQFRADAGAPLVAVGVTMPPWPGDGEAEPREGKWA